jgi:hypothetical protein
LFQLIISQNQLVVLYHRDSFFTIIILLLSKIIQKFFVSARGSLKTEIEERPEKQEFMVKAALVVQDIYFKRLTQLQSIDHYLDKAKLYEILKSSEEITGNIAQLKILASKDKEEAFKSKELNLIVEAQPHKKMAEEIKNIELLITNEPRETVLQISKLVKNE